jgi:hypothetical protein
MKTDEKCGCECQMTCWNSIVTFSQETYKKINSSFFYNPYKKFTFIQFNSSGSILNTCIIQQQNSEGSTAIEICMKRFQTFFS